MTVLEELQQLMESVASDTIPLYKTLANTIRELVESGRLQPGDHLPTQRDLAKQLGLSVYTVQRAYHILVQDRLVRGSGRGFRRWVAIAGTPRTVMRQADHAAQEHPDDTELIGTVRSIEQTGGEVYVVLDLSEGQHLTISTSRFAVQWLGLEPGKVARASVRMADALLVKPTEA